MKIQCQKCRANYDIPEERIRSHGNHITFPCPACSAPIEVRLDETAQAPGTGRQETSPHRGDAPTGDVLRKRIIRTVKDLPPMPQVAQKARQLTMDENSSFQDLSKIIETDQAIAARVLKLSNSSYYGQMGRVTSIQHASVVLGMKTLNELLTLACAGSLLGRELRGYGQKAGDLWMHSLATAEAARRIAVRHAPELVDDSFSAGLIHDCGKLILDGYVLERREQFDQFLSGGGKSFTEAEREILGFDHGRIAADVCEKWQIPRDITRAIESHHAPRMAGENRLANIVHAADAIALMSGIGAGVDGMMYQMDRTVMKTLQIGGDEVGLYMAEAMEFVEKTAAAFSS